MKKALLWILLLSVIVGSIWAFRTFYESYEKEIKTGYSFEALRNPFLAAQLFLKKNNVTVIEKTDVLDFSIIGTDETVFLSDVDDMILTQSQITKALEWVDSGGFLIVGVGSEIHGNASILERFDIDPIRYNSGSDNIFEGDFKPTSERLRELNEEIEEREKNGEPAGDGASLDLLLEDGWRDDATYYTVSLGDEFGEISLEVVDQIVLNHPLVGDDYIDDDQPLVGDYNDTYDLATQVSDIKGARALQFKYGQGNFTALSSSEMWKNKIIGEADHAFFLAYFVPEGSTVRFFYNVISPSLTTLLTRYFGESILIIFVLLLLWLWRSSLRVQVIKHEVTAQRRAFSEHLKAGAEFLVSKEQYSVLLMPIHTDIINNMRMHYPGYADMTQAKQISLISTTTQIPTEMIQTWFNTLTGVEDQEQMIASIKVGNAIRNRI